MSIRDWILGPKPSCERGIHDFEPRYDTTMSGTF